MINNNGISDQNQTHTERVWYMISMQEIKDYVHLIAIQDIATSLGVDIDFMKNISEKFNVNPLNSAALDTFSWECALKIIEIELHLNY